MITPADLARMLAHAADDHAQNPLEPDELLYTSQSVSLQQLQQLQHQSFKVKLQL